MRAAGLRGDAVQRLRSFQAIVLLSASVVDAMFALSVPAHSQAASARGVPPAPAPTFSSATAAASPHRASDTSLFVTPPVVPFFSDFDARSASATLLTGTAPFSDNVNELRAAFYARSSTYDTTAYRNIKHFNYGARAESFAGFNTSTLGWDPVFTSQVGIAAGAMSNIQNTENGVSGITSEAIQMGTGTASNEFTAKNPRYAKSQSVSMAAVQGIVETGKASSDDAHVAYGIVSSNISPDKKAATAAFASAFNVAPYQYLLDGRGSTSTVGGIHMPRSQTGDVGSRIVYDAGTYSAFGSAAFRWTANAVTVGTLGASGLRIGQDSARDAVLQGAGLAGSYTAPTTAASSLILYRVSETNAAAFGTDAGGNVYLANGTTALSGAQKWCAGGGAVIGRPTGDCPVAGVLNAQDLFVQGVSLSFPRSSTPASSSAPCTVGQQSWDTDYEYRCVGTNRWKRSRLADW